MLYFNKVFLQKFTILSKCNNVAGQQNTSKYLFCCERFKWALKLVFLIVSLFICSLFLYFFLFIWHFHFSFSLCFGSKERKKNETKRKRETPDWIDNHISLTAEGLNGCCRRSLLSLCITAFNVRTKRFGSAENINLVKMPVRA